MEAGLRPGERIQVEDPEVVQHGGACVLLTETETTKYGQLVPVECGCVMTTSHWHSTGHLLALPTQLGAIEKPHVIESFHTVEATKHHHHVIIKCGCMTESRWRLLTNDAWLSPSALTYGEQPQIVQCTSTMCPTEYNQPILMQNHRVGTTQRWCFVGFSNQLCPHGNIAKGMRTP